MNTTWRTDPRLKNMDQTKLELLTLFADDLSSKPKDQMLNSFLSLNSRAAKKGLHFTDSETELIVSILTEDMPPEEKKRLQMLKILAKQLSVKEKR